MSRVVFLGEQAGITTHDRKRVRSVLAGGDANALFNYSLFCGCRQGQTELGVVARFKPNESGQRSVVCPVCQNVTLLDRDLQIMGVVPLSKVLANVLVQ